MPNSLASGSCVLILSLLLCLPLCVVQREILLRIVFLAGFPVQDELEVDYDEESAGSMSNTFNQMSGFTSSSAEFIRKMRSISLTFL